ncbi:hypothetical protein ACPW7J_04165 [Ihubacter sp. rT4E-8]|uniref:hypothetical protein n=1 Tax=Ihubacter sp. rT4E-8 TaxID=3242369 RepID=UPI003CF3434E
MKKTKFLSLALTLALVFTTVFAGAESIFAETTFHALSSTITALDDTAGAPGSETNPVAAVNANSKEEAKAWSVAYSSSNPMVAAVSIPKAGTFEFNLMTTAYTRVYLFDSLEATDPVAYQDIAPSTTEATTFYAKAKKAGTYYLGFDTNSASEVEGAFNVYYAPAANATPTKGKTYHAASLSSTKFYYYKVTMAKTGYLTIDFPWGENGDSSSYSVKLMNAKKSKNLFKGVNKVDYNKGFVTYAGLPKGTYYVAVKTTDSMYGINLKATYPKENSGSSKAKAKTLLKGSTKKGVITATQSSSSGDWYKIKVSSKQKVYIATDTKTGGYSGGIRVSIYDSSKRFGYGDYYYGSPAGTLSPYTTINGYEGNKVLYPGTYWIKVQKYGSGSGYYTLQWK